MALPPGACGARFRTPDENRRWVRHFPSLASPGSASRSAFGSRSFAPEDGSCLLPLTLPFLPRRTIPFPEPPACSGLIGRCRGHHLTGAFQRPASARDRRILFLPSRLRHRRIVRLFLCRPQPRDPFPPHWLTVATIGLGPTVFAHAPPQPGGRRVTRFRDRLCGPLIRPDRFRVAHRLISRS